MSGSNRLFWSICLTNGDEIQLDLQQRNLFSSESLHNGSIKQHNNASQPLIHSTTITISWSAK
jgi:phage-related protein